MNSEPNYSPCDYVNRVQDNQPKPLTREYFETLLDDMNVKLLCEKVREHKPDAERYKSQLSAITWQASFGGKLRTAQNAQPTGMFCLDVDIHHEQKFQDIFKSDGRDAAYEWAETEALKRAERWAALARDEDELGPATPADELGIIAVHVSPSGMGVHVVACCHMLCKGIAENQARLARLLGTDYDSVCKDWPRIFFITPRSDWTYIDYKTLFAEC